MVVEDFRVMDWRKWVIAFVFAALANAAAHASPGNGWLFGFMAGALSMGVLSLLDERR
jgi:hypothetical protein